MTIDIETATAIGVWNLFIGSSEWRSVFDEGNRLKAFELQGTERGTKLATADGDFPQFYIRCAGGSCAPFSNGQTFKTHSPEGPSHWPEKGVVSIRIVLTAQLNSQSDINYAAAVTRNVLRSAGPRLGMSWIEEFSMSWDVARTASPPSEGDDTEEYTIRERVSISLSISTYHDGATLVALLNT